MSKRFPSAAPAPATLRGPSRAARRPGSTLFARAPLGALVLGALGACDSNAPGEPDTASGGASGTVAAPSPAPLGGPPFDDGYLTLDEALVLAATGQTVTLPAVGAATPSTSEPEPEPDPEPVTEVPDASPAPQAPGPDAQTPAPDATGDGNGGETGTDAGDEPAPAVDPVAPAPGTGDAPPPDVSPDDEVGDDTVGERFAATTTDGFAGEVLEDGSVRVRWAEDRGARGYNTYRDAEYVTTVFDTEWIDEDTHDGDFYYEIEAFDIADNFTRIATGLTVPVRGSGRADPEPDTRGTPQLDDYRLVFSEEFEGDALDLATWNTSYLWGDDLVINQEEQHYVDIENEPDFGFDPFEVGDGTLTISSVPTPPELADKANGQPYLSGVITSYDGFRFTYGYAEARAKVPYGKGFWSAFWLLNAFYGDDDPEIDIMEHIGDDQDVVYHTYHYYEDPETLRSTESFPVPGTDYIGGFHTYAVDWSPGLLIFYVDGRETHRVSDPRVSDQEMYIIANTALGGWWPGSPDATTEFPAEYEIDWIRVYQKEGPYDDMPFADGTPSSLPLFDDLPGTSPNHRPPLEMFPNGYPTR